MIFLKYKCQLLSLKKLPNNYKWCTNKCKWTRI